MAQADALSVEFACFLNHRSRRAERVKPKQLSFLKPTSKSYGGELYKTRKGRRGPRPIDTRSTMHLVLRSSQARGAWSFKRHAPMIRRLVDRFAAKNGVKVLSLANVGNHLHFHVKLGNRQTYRPFIRAVTAAIAMAVTGASRVRPLRKRFWDYRPFTRVVQGLRAFLTLKDYIEVNQLEGIGYARKAAREIIARRRLRKESG
jgi:hypothetical protein